MVGTIINTGAVVAGSLLGLLFHAKLPERVTKTAFQAIGLFTIFLGIHMATKSENYLLLIFSLVLGAVTGEIIGIEKLVMRFSEMLKRRLRIKNDKFTNGFITAFLLFCMGSMTILGAFEEGLGKEPNLLMAKSVLDGFSSFALSASMGVGVLFSAVPLFLYQASLTLFAGSMHEFFSPEIIAELTATGGILLIGLGIAITEIKDLKILNMTPALFFSVGLSYFFL